MVPCSKITFILISYHFDSFSDAFPGGSVVKNPPAIAKDTGSIPGLGRFPGEGNSNPLQYSCLGNAMDRGAWQATVHEATKSHILLNNERPTAFALLNYMSKNISKDSWPLNNAKVRGSEFLFSPLYQIIADPLTILHIHRFKPPQICSTTLYNLLKKFCV